jgi:hypothetical protein
LAKQKSLAFFDQLRRDYMRVKALVGLTFLSLTLAACGGAKEGEGTKTADAPAAAASGGTGVAECDDLFKKIETCFTDKIPAEQRGMMESAFKQEKERMSAMTDKAQMAQACKAAGEQSKASYAAMGCTF